MRPRRGVSSAKGSFTAAAAAVPEKGVPLSTQVNRPSVT